MELQNAIAINDVSHAYDEGGLCRKVLCHVSAELREGEILLMTGPSGSGKTTLLTLIGALRAAEEGSLRVLGEELVGASEATLVRVRRQIGYIAQGHNLLESLTAVQNVEMPLLLQQGISRGSRRRLALDVLAAVGLAEHADRYPSELSGGQRQRVAVARALVGQPKIILADEPTASLDKQSGRDVVEMLSGLARRRGCTVLVVTHDSRILDIADRVLHLEDGRLSSLVSDGPLAA